MAVIDENGYLARDDRRFNKKLDKNKRNVYLVKCISETSFGIPLSGLRFSKEYFGKKIRLKISIEEV